MRRVMELYYYEGLTLIEVKRQLGCCMTTVTDAKSRALELIRESLAYA